MPGKHTIFGRWAIGYGPIDFPHNLRSTSARRSDGDFGYRRPSRTLPEAMHPAAPSNDLTTNNKSRRATKDHSASNKHSQAVLVFGRLSEPVTTKLKLYSMKAVFDEIMATAVNDSTNLSALSVIYSTPRSARSRRARSSTSSPLLSCRLPRTSTTSSSRARRSTRRSCTTSPAATSSPSSATLCRLPALVPSPQPRPAPTRRALIAQNVKRRGPCWMPKGVPIRCRLTLPEGEALCP